MPARPLHITLANPQLQTKLNLIRERLLILDEIHGGISQLIFPLDEIRGNLSNISLRTCCARFFYLFILVEETHILSNIYAELTAQVKDLFIDLIAIMKDYYWLIRAYYDRSLRHLYYDRINLIPDSAVTNFPLPARNRFISINQIATQFAQRAEVVDYMANRLARAIQWRALFHLPPKVIPIHYYLLPYIEDQRVVENRLRDFIINCQQGEAIELFNFYQQLLTVRVSLLKSDQGWQHPLRKSIILLYFEVLRYILLEDNFLPSTRRIAQQNSSNLSRFSSLKTLRGSLSGESNGSHLSDSSHNSSHYG